MAILKSTGYSLSPGGVRACRSSPRHSRASPYPLSRALGKGSCPHQGLHAFHYISNEFFFVLKSNWINFLCCGILNRMLVCCHTSKLLCYSLWCLFLGPWSAGISEGVPGWNAISAALATICWGTYRWRGRAYKPFMEQPLVCEPASAEDADGELFAVKWSICIPTGPADMLWFEGREPDSWVTLHAYTFL